jgi:hypothetical protein
MFSKYGEIYPLEYNFSDRFGLAGEKSNEKSGFSPPSS